MSKTGIAAIALALWLSAVGAAGPARGQFFQSMPGGPSAAPNIEGFTVNGKGSVSARPDLVEIDLEVAAGSELTADAIVKYRDARRKLREAFAALKLANVAVEERGLLVDQKSSMGNSYWFGFQPNQRTKAEVQLTRKLVVRGSDIRKMDEDGVLQLVAKLLDVAQDAGGRVGSPPADFNPYFYNPMPASGGLVRFVIEDFDKLQEEAYEKAIADARSRAERLARLSKVELGPIVAIREVAVPGEIAPSPDDARQRKRLETSKFQEIPIRVELLVRFEVHSKADGKGADSRPMTILIDPGETRNVARLMTRRAFLSRSRSAAAIAGVGAGFMAGVRLGPAAAAEKEVLPKHVTPETLRSVIKGLDFLASRQAEDGSWISGGGEAYPVAMTGLAGTALLAHGNSPTRGHYSKNLQGTVEFLVRCGTATGLITGPGQDNGQPMHGHGFALMFLACVYGMITKESLRNQVRSVIRKAVALTSQGQSPEGGWTYIPGAGDEGSVTVTQVQALRAAHNAGFLVPRAVIEEAVKYLERCRTAEGGIEYSLRSGGGPRLPISAAAVATLYNAGQFDSTIATDCLKYVWDQFRASESFSKGGGHDFYTHLYAAQGFYMAGDLYWDAYFPRTRDQLIGMQQPDGSWQGDGIGQVYGTAIAAIILQLPYKYLPVFQR